MLGHLIVPHLFDWDPDDVGRDDLDDVKLQQPPDEELQLLHVLQELQEQHRQTLHHQMPLTLQPFTGERHMHHLQKQQNVPRVLKVF